MCFFFFSSRRRHTRSYGDWSSDVCSSDLIEKAHPDVWNMLLQIIEAGRLTDNVGRTIDFKNTILIMTTNIGAEQITGRDALGFSKKDEHTSYEKMKAMLKQEMERNFRPEFLNRVDDIIV